MEAQETGDVFEDDPETTSVLKTFANIENRLSDAKDAGLIAEEDKPTKFARTDFQIDDETKADLLQLVDQFTGTVIARPGTTETPDQQSGDLIFNYDKGMIDLKVAIPDTTNEEETIDAPSEQIHLKYYTDGMHDIDLEMDIPSKWVKEEVPEGEVDEPTFRLKVTFDPEDDPAKALTYNSGRLPFNSMTDEEAEIITYYLKETIDATKKKPEH